jgi:hypothetical protein
MVHERSGRSGLIAAAILALSAVVFITGYGWLPAINAVYPLFLAALWASAIAIASWGAGELVTRSLFDRENFSLERIVLVLGVGTAVLMASAGVLAVAHLLHPTLLLITLAGWACLGGLQLYRNPPHLSLTAEPVCLPPALILLAASCLVLVSATTFAPFYDQWNYHLGFPYQWLRAGTIVTFPDHAYSFLPSNSGLLYLYALSGPGPWGAQVAHWWLGLLAAGGSAAVARRLGAKPHGQLLAAVVFAATPSIVQLGALAGGDLGVATFGIFGVLAILNLREGPKPNLPWMVVAGAFSGLAVGCKYTAIGQVVIPLGMVGLALVFSASERTGKSVKVVLHAAAFALAFSVVAGPWLLRNTAATGNPVYPYFQGLVDETDTTESDTTSDMGAFEIGPRKIATSLTLGTFARRGQAGDIGPVHLWLLPLVVYWIWRRRKSGQVWAAFGVFLLSLAFWGIGPNLGRYLIPTLAVSSALSGAAWDDVTGTMSRSVRSLFAVFLYVFLITNCSPVRGEYLLPQLECALGARDEIEYIERHSTQLEAFRTANEMLPVDARVLLVGEPRVFGIDRDVIVEDGFRTPLLVTLAESSDSAELISERLHELGVSHLLLNRAEADRLAGARGREQYLECSTRKSQDLLAEFIARHTRPLFEGGWWEIRRLEATGD